MPTIARGRAEKPSERETSRVLRGDVVMTSCPEPPRGIKGGPRQSASAPQAAGRPRPPHFFFPPTALSASSSAYDETRSGMEIDGMRTAGSGVTGGEGVGGRERGRERLQREEFAFRVRSGMEIGGMRTAGSGVTKGGEGRGGGGAGKGSRGEKRMRRRQY